MTAEQFLELAGLLPEPMLLVTADAQFLSANPPFLEIIGIKKNSLNGKSLLEFAASPHDKITRYLQNCAKTRHMLLGSIDLRHADGQITGYRCDGALVRPRLQESPALILLRLKQKESASSKFTSLTRKVSELNREIAERKRTEIALKESEKRFRQLADAMPQMVWTARPDGSPDYFNRRWDEFTGFSEDEYGNWIWQKILHPEDVERYNDTWHGAVESGSAYEIEYRFRDYRAGSYRWFLGRAEPVRDEAGRIVKWFGTCTDINEQKLAVIERDKLLRKENEARKIAENANRLKDEFLATVSHELRTPLNAILGWSSIAQSPGTDTAAMKRALEIIVRSARSQHQIIEDILDVSRIITGKLILNIESVELIPVIYSALDSIRPALEAKKIRLKTDFDKKAEIISGDSNRLQQIVWNLLSNAAKFTQPEGEIAVLLKRSGNYAELSICDSGNGISPDFLPFVFERFTQADGSSTRRYGGLGLGLAIARHLVELHGGNIYAHSDGVGCGSVFTVNLPLAIMQSGIAEPLPPSRETKSRETSNIPKTALSGVKVLVVDDESDARELLKVILGQYGAEVITAESAEEALNNLSLSLPHVLVSDIGMPGSDGYELIRRVRNYPPASRLHAVALTAYAGKEDRERALSEGFNDYLSKPVEASELIEIVARLNGRG